MDTSEKMPMIFIGHGSPMNAIEENIYTESWREIGKKIPKPKVILMFSAHFMTEHETHISITEYPDMIYDMYGFPDELYRVRYPAKGNPKIANFVIELLIKKGFKVSPVHRGFDHGVWSTLIHLFPEADIPVVTMSLDYHMSLRDLIEIGAILSPLRDEGVLVIGSGNIVHNLRAIDWSGKEKYSWAVDFDERIARGLEGGRGSKEWEEILEWKTWESMKLAHPSWDHLLPLFPLMGASSPGSIIEFYTPDIVMGSLSMRSVVFSEKEE